VTGPVPARPTAGALVGYFLRLGSLGFGGPIALVGAMQRDLVDERGDDAYNMDLSERRAAAVMQYLIAHGVDPRRLTSRGYGETQPVDKRHNEAAWAVNRRVSFVLRRRKED
jgi:hypothetical protein